VGMVSFHSQGQARPYGRATGSAEPGPQFGGPQI